MTAVLARAVDQLDLPAAPGITTRAVRTVLRRMASLARDDGTMRYGLRGSRLAELTDYSLSVVRRAQRYLVDHGLVERVKVGGGRYSTHWRIAVDKLRPGHTSRPPETQQPAAPRHSPGSPRPIWTGWKDARRSAPNSPLATTTPPAWRPGRVEACEHGGLTGTLPDGRPRCPMCRRR